MIKYSKHSKSHIYHSKVNIANLAFGKCRQGRTSRMHFNHPEALKQKQLRVLKYMDLHPHVSMYDKTDALTKFARFQKLRFRRKKYWLAKDSHGKTMRSSFDNKNQMMLSRKTLGNEFLKHFIICLIVIDFEITEAFYWNERGTSC